MQGAELQAESIAAQTSGRCNSAPVTKIPVGDDPPKQSLLCQVLVADAYKVPQPSKINKQDLCLSSRAHGPSTKAPRNTYTAVKDFPPES